MVHLSLKRDNTNISIYSLDGDIPDFSSLENKETLIFKINCVQPFETNKTEGYDYARLINEAHSWVKKHFKDQYDIFPPVYHNNFKCAGTGISSIEFECTIIKNTIP